MSIDGESERLRNWYVATGRRFIEHEAPDRLAALDAAFDRLTAQAVPELPICFLGAAGVGKSTLLNALVAGHSTIVPQGGIGPLTAQATMIRHGEQRKFRATYLPASSLNKLLFALERSYEAEQRRTGTHPVIAIEDLGLDGDEAVLDMLIAPDLADDGPPISPANEKLDAYRRQASQLIQGVQYAGEAVDQRYLMDAIRRCLELAPRWGSEPRPQDEARIARLRFVLAERDSAREVFAELAGASFFHELVDHASGHLAPLIRTLEVWWDAPLLKDGLVLVDLPGVGVANNEEHRRITAEWIRRARAVVLVVDRAGVTEASAEMLRSSGFLNSLLHDDDDPDVEAARLFVATVKLDLVASDDRNSDRQLGTGLRRWSAYFEAACERSIHLVRGQLRSELTRLSDDGADATREARLRVVERVLAELEVVPLSPYEYRLFLRGDEEDRPHIADAESSRVPAFAARLATIGEARATQLRARAIEHYNNARDRAAAAIQLVVEQWQAGDRVAEDAARLREELLKVAGPLEDQMLVRQGQFRELLRNSIPSEIEANTRLAAHDARKDIVRHLRRYEDYHWKTLVAAVRKGGTFDGARHIDLPNELTLRFEEPLAVVWSQKILPKLRRATREITEDYASLVGHVVDWARAQGGRVKPALVEGLQQELAAQAREVGAVGKEAIGELKERVKLEIYKSVETEVRRRCMRFVQRKLDGGLGVKARVLDFLQELPEAIVDVAHPAAFQIFQSNFRLVEAEIVAAIGRVENPIRQAVDSIVSEHETQARRSDAERSRHVITAGRAALAALPEIAAQEQCA